MASDTDSRTRRAWAGAAWMGDRVGTYLAPLFDLGLRLYLANVFLRAGILKLSDWSATLDLFDYVYQVPFLPPHLAAVMGTAGEVGLTSLLLLGLCGRFAAAGLLLVNAMAAVSLPDISDLGLHDHYLWCALIAMLAFHGPGALSVDAWIARRAARGQHRHGPSLP